MLFQVIGAMAEFEREIIRERVIAGLRQAKKKGKKLGRPRVRFDVEMARRLRGEGLSYKVVAKRLGISVGAIHEVLTKS
jgi:DNA invertase Pin-like site-specific DNA recombinase